MEICENTDAEIGPFDELNLTLWEGRQTFLFLKAPQVILNYAWLFSSAYKLFILILTGRYQYSFSFYRQESESLTTEQIQERLKALSFNWEV